MSVISHVALWQRCITYSVKWLDPSDEEEENYWDPNSTHFLQRSLQPTKRETDRKMCIINNYYFFFSSRNNLFGKYQEVEIEFLCIYFYLFYNIYKSLYNKH